MATLHSGLATASFGNNKFATAYGGSIFFGDTNLEKGVLLHTPTKTITVQEAKFGEFGKGIKVLATSILTKNDALPITDKLTVELSEEVFLVFEKNAIIKQKGDTILYKIIFDLFQFFDFIRALEKIALFVTNPTIQQFEAAQRYLSLSVEEVSYDKAVDQENKRLTNEESLLLKHYLYIHHDTLNFISEMKKLSKK